jgi:hypothetical protein
MSIISQLWWNHKKHKIVVQNAWYWRINCLKFNTDETHWMPLEAGPGMGRWDQYEFTTFS